MSAETVVEPIETVLVKTYNGPVRGRKRSGWPEYISFQGIPFAKPPVGDLRFKAPVPVDNWTDPIDALQHPPVPFAVDFLTEKLDPRSSEDCLYLNVYTKDVQPFTLRPVMLFIHGGGFMVGSTDETMFSPDFLLRTDIVFVSVAYRLGALGFLSVADPAVGIPGNAGLKDQALGMRWVRDNIAAFGGDPQCVTLFGESAGAASVHYHMLSDYSRGLFQRAILQSGTALSMWAQQPRKDLNGQLARKLGWSGEGGAAEMVRVLREANAAEIVQHQHLEQADDKQRGHYFVYTPVVEPYGADTEGCFLPRDPAQLAERAWGNSIPLLIGCTSDEAYLFYDEWKKNTTMFDDNGYFVNALPQCLNELSLERREELTAQLVRHYYGDEQPSAANLDKFVELQSDKFFWHGCLKAIRARQRQADSAATFLYRFSFDSELPGFSALKMMMAGERVKGAIHAEELMYLFKFAFVDYNFPDGSDESHVIDMMVNIWSTFSLCGHPMSQRMYVPFDQATEDAANGFKCLNIGKRLEWIDLPETKRIAIWDALEREQ